GANWNSQIVLVNPSEDQMSGEVRFLSPGSAVASGMPVEVAIDTSGASASVLQYDIPPRSFQRIQTTGTPVSSAFSFTTNNGFSFRSTGLSSNQSVGFASATPNTSGASLN